MQSVVTAGITFLELFLVLGIVTYFCENLCNSMGIGEYGKAIRMGGSLFISIGLIRQVMVILAMLETLYK